eukprot:XP_001694711.1 predicted protein [Chlamydomonas reinhardtii]
MAGSFGRAKSRSIGVQHLHKIGGVPVLLELLESPAPGLRWRAAEVVATCVANNPPVQEWFLEGGVLPKLLALAAPPQPPSCRTKALLALSGLVGAVLRACVCV